MNNMLHESNHIRALLPLTEHRERRNNPIIFWNGQGKIKKDREKYAPEKNKGKEGGEKIDSNKKRVGKYYERKSYVSLDR